MIFDPLLNNPYTFEAAARLTDVTLDAPGSKVIPMTTTSRFAGSLMLLTVLAGFIAKVYPYMKQGPAEVAPVADTRYAVVTAFDSPGYCWG